MGKVSFIGDFQASHGLRKGDGNGTPRRTVPTAAFHVFPPILRVVSSAVILGFSSIMMMVRTNGIRHVWPISHLGWIMQIPFPQMLLSNKYGSWRLALNRSKLTTLLPFNHLEPGKRIAIQQKIVPVGLLTGNIYRGPQKDRRVSRML